MKFLLCALLILTVGACASRREKAPAQVEQAAVKSEAAYGGNCAMGLCLRKSVKGDEKYSVDYKGKHYLFSSPEAKENFLKDIDSNIIKADAQWAKSSPDKIK